MRLFSGKPLVLIVALLMWSCFALAQTATVVQNNSGFATGGTNPSVSFPNANTAGNLLWVAVGSDATIATPTDVQGNTYTLAISITGSGGSGNAAIYYATSALPGANTITCNHSGNGNTHCHIAEINGLVATSPLDQTGSVGSSSSCGVSTSGATTQANEWVGAFFYDSPNSKTLIAGTGYSGIQLSNNTSSGDSALSESQNVGSVGVQTATCGGNSSNVLSQLITTFKASGAGTGPFIISLSPTTGGASTVVTINGSNFGSSQGKSTVTFNGTIATPTIWSSGSIQVPVPTGATTGNVVVTVSGTASNGVNFTIPPGPAIVVQSKSSFATGGTNPSVTFPNKNTAGNLLWVAVGSDATITTPTDTLGNTYILAVKTTGSGGSGNTAIYYASPARAGANTVTCNHSGNGDTHCHAAEVAGLVPSSPLDQTGSVASSANCGVSTSAATAQANEWVAAFFYDSPTSKTMATGNGYSKLQLSVNNSSGDSALSESQDVTSTGVQTATCSGNSSNVLSQLITTFIAQASKPVISDFNPKSAPAGTLISLTGTNLNVNGNPQVILNQQGGGSIAAPLTSASATNLSFVIPAGASSGPVTVNSGNSSGVSADSLNVIASSGFGLTVGPPSANVQQGTSVSYAVSLSSSNGFSQLAALSAAGAPSGVTTSFLPAQITAGQTSIFTVTAPAGQPVGSSILTVSAAATVDGIPAAQSANASLTIQAASTSLIGRIVESDSKETPIPGITATFLGVDDAGNKTGCSGQTRADAAGNFAFTNLSSSCLGRQLVAYDGNTATDGEKYAGVNLAYTMVAGQITGPELVHLPAISDAETIMIQQNAPNDQVFSYKTIPGVVVTVYAGTTLTLPNGTQPNPFPMAAVLVPVDRLPDNPVPTTGLLRASIVAFQPANTTTNQPVSVTFPNVVNTPPGVNVELDTLDPIVGELVKYGTGTVSGDGTQIVPDPDPANPGHRFGISHFDWHGPQAPAPNDINPSPDPDCPTCGDPVDPASGIFVFTKPDISFGGARGRVEINRTYRTLAGTPGPFGVGTSHNYSYQLGTFSFLQGQGFITLVMPDGNQFPFSQQPDGTLTNSTIPSLRGAVITVPSGGVYNLTFKDKTVFQFQASTLGPRTAFLASIADRNGNTTTFVRGNSESPAQISQIIDPVGKSLTLTYDGFDRIASITDPIGRVVSYSYNSQGTLSTVTDAAGGITRYEYDPQNRMISVTDPRGILHVQNTYDQNGKVIRQSYPDGGVMTYDYTLLNPNVSVCEGATCNSVNTSPVLLTKITDPLGNQTIYHFNAQGFLIDTTDALGQKTVYTLEPGTNLVLSVTDPLNRTHAFTYDSVGNITSSTLLAGTPDAVTTSFTYEPSFNRMTSIVNPLGKITRFGYDPSGNLISITDPLGHKATFSYDASGEMVSAQNALGHTIAITYTDGNPTNITDPLGNTTTHISDVVGRRIATVSPLNQITRRIYDALDRVTAIIDPAGGTTAFTYDANDNLITRTDPKNHVTKYTYDAVNQLIAATDPLLRQSSHQYDTNGNLIRSTDRRGNVTTFSYDPLNRNTFIGFGSSGASFESTVSFTYDAVNRLTKAADSVTGTIVDSYDDLDLLASEVTAQGIVNYAYDTASRKTAMSVAGQPQVSYVYDASDRLTNIMQGTTTVTFAYDDADRRTSATLPNGVLMTYAYDNAARITGLTYTSGANTIGDLKYTYDALGQVTETGGSLARIAAPNLISSASYDPANELTSLDGKVLTYDADGNLLTDGVNNFLWNARGQLASMNGVQPAYDAFNRRVRNFTGRSLLYDGFNVVQELAGGIPITNFLDGKTDELFSRSDSKGISSPLVDMLGSVVGLTDQSGAIITTYTYDSFGSTASGGAPSDNTNQYTARENDGTGIYYYRARYYYPALGRFLSEDPLAFKAGNNLYQYVLNNPVRYVDKLGTDIWLEGPNANEPAGHLSINVGDPNGNYNSYSFGVNGDPGLGGAVYNDVEHGGEILPDKYLHTIPDEDAKANALLQAELGKKAPYRPWRTCRNFSQNQFNRMKDLGLGKPGAPPPRQPAPGSKPWTVPSTTSTSAWDWLNLRSILSSSSSSSGSGSSK